MPFLDTPVLPYCSHAMAQNSFSFRRQRRDEVASSFGYGPRSYLRGSAVYLYQSSSQKSVPFVPGLILRSEYGCRDDANSAVIFSPVGDRFREFLFLCEFSFLELLFYGLTEVALIILQAKRYERALAISP